MNPMTRTADHVLQESVLDVRAKLLEIAATLDRIDRVAIATPLSENNKPSRSRIDDALQILLSQGPDRAERLQRLFSRQYQANWRQEMQV